MHVLLHGRVMMEKILWRFVLMNKAKALAVSWHEVSVELASLSIEVSMSMSRTLCMVLRMALVMVHGHLLDLCMTLTIIKSVRSHLRKLLS